MKKTPVCKNLSWLSSRLARMMPRQRSCQPWIRTWQRRSSHRLTPLRRGPAPRLARDPPVPALPGVALALIQPATRSAPRLLTSRAGAVVPEGREGLRAVAARAVFRQGDLLPLCEAECQAKPCSAMPNPAQPHLAAPSRCLPGHTQPCPAPPDRTKPPDLDRPCHAKPDPTRPRLAAPRRTLPGQTRPRLTMPHPTSPHLA